MGWFEDGLAPGGYVERIVVSIGVDAVGHIREGLVSHRKTGETERSVFGPIVERVGNTFQVVVGATAKQAVFLEEGTRPHEILGNPFLAWDGAAGRVVINAGVTPVQHPGTEATHLFRNAVEEAVTAAFR
jgi:hypothetical protein